MLAQNFACPQCHAVLKTAKPVPVGKTVKCPKCNSLFAVPGEVAPIPVVAVADLSRSAPPPLPASRPALHKVVPVAELDTEPAGRYDNGDDFDRPPKARRKSRRSKRGNGLMIGLIVGGVVGVLLLVGGVVAIIFLAGGGNNRERIIGTWRSTNSPIVVTLDFSRDGTLTQDLGMMKVTQKYRFLNDNTIEVELQNPMANFAQAFPQNFPNPPGGMPRIQFNMPSIRQQFRVSIRGDEMTLNMPMGVQQFQRVR
jgi:hypothetical protein